MRYVFILLIIFLILLSREVTKISITEEKIENFIENLDKEDWKGLYGILLYTSEHKNLAEFMSENKQLIHSLTGKNILIYMITEPKKPVHVPGTHAEIVSDVKPIEIGYRTASDAIYDICDLLDIRSRDLPVLAISTDFTTKNIVIYKINQKKKEKLMDQFEDIRDIIDECLEDPKNESDMTKVLECVKSRKNLLWVGQNLLGIVRGILDFAFKLAPDVIKEYFIAKFKG